MLASTAQTFQIPAASINWSTSNACAFSFFFFYAIDVSGSVQERLPPVSINLSKKIKKKLLPDLTNFAWIHCKIKQDLLSRSWMTNKTEHKAQILINCYNNLLREAIC